MSLLPHAPSGAVLAIAGFSLLMFAAVTAFCWVQDLWNEGWEFIPFLGLFYIAGWVAPTLLVWAVYVTWFWKECSP